eukprot:scaffold123081_cov22-Tisochrysis_lutea.AAC.1
MSPSCGMSPTLTLTRSWHSALRVHPALYLAFSPSQASSPSLVSSPSCALSLLKYEPYTCIEPSVASSPSCASSSSCVPSLHAYCALHVLHHSFTQQEDEAAKSFDRAAIRLRGQRAKLNYHISTYQDEFGQIIEDKKLSVRVACCLFPHAGHSRVV